MGSNFSRSLQTASGAVNHQAFTGVNRQLHFTTDFAF